MRLKQLRDRLAELRKNEAVAVTREQVLSEEKERLLSDINVLYAELNKLEIFREGELTPGNLSSVISTLQNLIDTELAKLSIPKDIP